MNTRAIRIIPFLIALIMLILLGMAEASTFTVNNTNDSGAGSLRWAISKVNFYGGNDLIDFAIPLTDPGYNIATGVWTISLLSELDTLTDNGTTIDGTTQIGFIGYDTNPNGREIEIEGSSAGNACGLIIQSSWNTILGLTINRFDRFGILIIGPETRFNSVRGNFIGTDPNGLVDLGNDLVGIMVSQACRHNTIGGQNAGEGNLVSGNDASGIDIQGYGTDSNYVYGNFVGIDYWGNSAIPNGQYGISIWSGPQGTIIGGPTGLARNVASGNLYSGIRVASNAPRTIVQSNYVGVSSLAAHAVPNMHDGISCGGPHSVIGGAAPGEGNIVGGNRYNGLIMSLGDSITVTGNYIGTNASGTLDLGNVAEGMYIGYGAQDHTITSNTIWNNGGDGVLVEHDSTSGIRITQNSISYNAGQGINNMNGGNTELTPPTIAHSDAAATYGMAPHNCTIEIYSDGLDEGRVYEGAAFSTTSGDWYWNGTATGPRVTAIAIDLSGNTSEFSLPWIPTNVVGSDAEQLPAVYSLSRNRPNPFNPLTTISYRLPKGGPTNLAIYNTAGELVETIVSEWQEAGSHSAVWAPRGGRVASGLYLYKLESGSFSAVQKMTLVR